MNEPERGSSGWTAAKILGLIVGLIGMVGFGICSICGLVIVPDMRDGGIMMLVLLGAGLSVLSGWLVATMVRKAREDRERNQ